MPDLGIILRVKNLAHHFATGETGFVRKEDLHRIVCNKLVCPYKHECMTQLPVEEMVRKVERMILKN